MSVQQQHHAEEITASCWLIMRLEKHHQSTCRSACQGTAHSFNVVILTWPASGVSAVLLMSLIQRVNFECRTGTMSCIKALLHKQSEAASSTQMPLANTLVSTQKQAMHLPSPVARKLLDGILQDACVKSGHILPSLMR